MDLENKKVLLLSTGDAVGGAYELMYRMASALNGHCEHVCLAVKTKHYTDPFVKKVNVIPQRRSILQRITHSLKSRLHLAPMELASVARREYVFFYEEEEEQVFVSANDLLRKIGFTPDIIFVGLTTGFINTNEIAHLQDLTGAKIVYVMLDVYPITGGCHVLFNCTEYKRSCVQCPAVSDTVLNKKPSEQFNSKKQAYARMKPLFIGATGLVSRVLGESVLSCDAPIIPVNSCVPTAIFNTNSRGFAKQFWNLPKGKKIILAGADNVRDPRKGRRYFIDALKILENKHSDVLSNVVVVLVGNHNTADAETKQIPVATQYIDYIRDMRLLSLLYQASDVYVMSSVEEGGPMMVPEAMLCGTLIVGFQTGFLENEDIIQSGKNGFRIPIADVGKMADSLHKILLMSDSEISYMANNARQKAMETMSDSAFISILEKYKL